MGRRPVGLTLPRRHDGASPSTEWSGPAEQVVELPADAAGHEIVQGNFDGDGTDTLALQRGAQFFVSDSNATDTGVEETRYGRDGDTAVFDDWDGNGTDTLGVVRIEQPR